jgi:hypothetical protein
MAKKHMPKKPRPVANKLPLVQVAALCEHVLQEKDGVMSAIRIFDRLNIPRPGSPPPGLAPDAPPLLPVKFLIALKSGSVRGKRTIKVIYICPDGTTGQAVEAVGVFEGGEQGVQIHGAFVIPVKTEGLYWCDVLVNGMQVTRVPLRIDFTKPPPEEDKTSKGTG